MSSEAQGDATSHHRARLYPLPILAAVARPPSLSSARARYRFKLQRTIAAVTNRCICTLNRLYNSPSFQPPSSSSPDNPSFSCSCCFVFDFISAQQHRALAHLRAQCTAFVLKARSWSFHHDHASDIHSSALDFIQSFSTAGGRFAPPPATPASRAEERELDSLNLSLPQRSSFSSAPTAVVPLIASRISLPTQLNIVPMHSILPQEIAALYVESASSALLRPPIEVLALDHLQPLRPARIAGSRHEYVQLVGRMLQQGMVSFTAAPKAVNGVFAVAKDAESDRLIIDAQPCNRLFIDSPHVSLPGPSHLVQLQVPRGASMFSAKTDLSNFYHHIGIEPWMQPYLALPPLTPAELTSIGASAAAAYPMCVTLSMGFSHAVYIANSGHQHVLYRSGAVHPRDSLLCLTSPLVTSERALHGIVVDDFFAFSRSRKLLHRIIQRALAAYTAAGFVVKQSKVVMPTSEPVKVIGFDIDGAESTISLPADSQLSLIQATLATLRAPTVTGTQLSHIVGRWTWLLMLRRCTLAVLQHVYLYSRAAQRRPFTLWPSARRELCMLLSLLPLLHARLDSPNFSRAIASDASELAGGVVVTPLTPALHSQLWPLCSSRHHAVKQSKLNAARKRSAHPLASPQLHAAPLQPDLSASAAATFDSFYDVVGAASWRTIVSKPWVAYEHINALELRAALLAVHWVLSHPSSLNSRVYLLLDSTVSFFSLWKGRSSSPQLLLILRKISALLLAGGLSLLPGWVPSAVNPADAPSRSIDDCPTSGRASA